MLVSTDHQHKKQRASGIDAVLQMMPCQWGGLKTHQTHLEEENQRHAMVDPNMSAATDVAKEKQRTCMIGAGHELPCRQEEAMKPYQHDQVHNVVHSCSAANPLSGATDALALAEAEANAEATEKHLMVGERTDCKHCFDSVGNRSDAEAHCCYCVAGFCRRRMMCALTATDTD